MAMMVADAGGIRPLPAAAVVMVAAAQSLAVRKAVRLEGRRDRSLVERKVASSAVRLESR